jgi:glycerate 2-kinase
VGVVRVVVAPDKFAGTVSAAAAAAAIAGGWRSRRPGDDVVQLPMSDGGPGFVAVLSAALGAAGNRSVATTDPLGRPVTAELLVHDATAYVESAQAVGLHLLADSERDPERTTSAGLAALLEAALDCGAGRIVVGLGGSATNDGGRGLIEALAPDARERLATVELVAATDVGNPLLGPGGAAAVFGPQKGADREAVARLEGRMQAWVGELDGLAAVADRPGAGAAGGLGAALYWLGGQRQAGAPLVAEAIGLEVAMTSAALVVTGEGSYDVTSLRGKVVSAVAEAAGRMALPCVVVAGQVGVGRREAAAHGVDETVSLAELAGSVAAAMEHAERWLADAGSRLAARWSRG